MDIVAIWQWACENWQVVVPVLVIIISELLPFLPTEANGIAQAVLNILKKIPVKTAMFLLFLFALPLASGCATTSLLQQGMVIKETPAEEQVKPLSNFLDKLTSNALTDFTEDDCNAAIAWCNSAEGPKDEARKLLCPGCAQQILAGKKKIVAIKDKIKSRLATVKQSIGSGKGLVERSTKWSFGEGIDISQDIDDAKKEISQTAIYIRNACMNNIPEYKLLELAEFAFGFKW